MGKRKDPKRRKILQLKSNQETYTQIWPRNQPVLQAQNPNINMDNGNTQRNNPLSGLLSHYMDCDDDDDEEDETSEKEDTKNIEIENTNSNPHSIDLEVADFLKEIDAITADEVAETDGNNKKANEERKNDDWQECVDETTGYTYYWNVGTNEVTWEYPKTLQTSTNIKKKESKKMEKEKLNEESIDGADDGKIVPITFYGPGSSNGESSNEDADSPSVENDVKKMGPHLPPEDEFDVNSNKTFDSPDERTNLSAEDEIDEPDSTTRAKQLKENSNLFCGPPNAAQVLASSLDDESDSDEMAVPVFPTTDRASHKGLGFGLRGDENGVKNGGKNGKGDMISFVKAETLDLNAINRIAASEWANGKPEKVEQTSDDANMETKAEIQDEIDVDRELDLALERNDDITQLANGIFNQLERLGVNTSAVTNLQKIYIEIQTRLEDFRQGAVKRSYLLGKLRETEKEMEEIHELHTCKDRLEGDVNQPDTTGNSQQQPSDVSSSTVLLSIIGSSIEDPPLPPPPPPESPPPPPPDSTAHVTTMEVDDYQENTDLAQPDMQMELNSFYSDIGMLSEAEVPASSVPLPSVPSTSGLQAQVVNNVPSVSSTETTSIPVVKKEKKLKKARIATGLVLKKKNMPYLVEKWQKIKRDEARNASSSDDEKGVSTTRHHSDD